MEIVKIRPNNPEKIIKKVVNILKQGGVIIYPTDTVYGLGANALDEDAVNRVFKIKKRPFSKPISVLVRNAEMASKIAVIDEKTRKILGKIWPGPVTVILNKRGDIPRLLTAGSNKIGLRIPDYKFSLVLMTYLDFPITATSANISGKASSGDINQILDQFQPLTYECEDNYCPNLVLDAGKLAKCEPSTILDLSESKPKILRNGPASKADLFKILNNI